MQPYEPYQGVLLMPDRRLFGSMSAVTLRDGTPVAVIRRRNWSPRDRFEILDARGEVELASGRRERGRRYTVSTPDDRVLLTVTLSFWRPIGRAVVQLPDGQLLLTSDSSANRQFLVSDQAGRPLASIVTSNRGFSPRTGDLSFELQAPVLSIVQAVGLAQCVRAAVEGRRRAIMAAAAHGGG